MKTVVIVLALTGVVVLLPWLGVWYNRYVPRWLERGAILAILHATRWLHLAVLVLGPLGVLLGAVGIFRARLRRQSWRGAGKVLVVCGVLVLMIAPTEWIAARWLRFLHRIPELPQATLKLPTAQDSDADLTLVVIGGSTAMGQPYDPLLSIGQIVAWQLEQALPGRRVNVDIRASGGICLEQAVNRLNALEVRPDIMLICAGHNEFQARYGWSRNVAYYVDEGLLPSRPSLSEWLAQVSSVQKMVKTAIETNRLDVPPPPRVTRTLVDGPAFTTEEAAFLLEDYGRRLDIVLDYCRTLEVLPIVVLPAGNLEYPPARSFMGPEATEEDRRAFDAAFVAVREREDADPLAAEAGYRRLLEREPTFAEAHFRLARLLKARGAVEEAATHFREALDHDGMPMRCREDFQQMCRQVAERYGAVFVDGPRVLEQASPTGISGDDLFHDAHHPTLRGYVALAQQVIHALADRGESVWPEHAPVPRLDPRSVAAIAALDAAAWAQVCRRAASFYARTAYMRFDPDHHLKMAHQYNWLADRIESGEDPQELDEPALSLDPIEG